MTEEIELSTETIEIDDIPVVRAQGEIDLYTIPPFQDALHDAIQRSTDAVVADLRGISYIDSAGLSELLVSYKALAAKGAALYVVIDPDRPGVRHVMEITRLDQIFKVRYDLDKTIQEIRSHRES